MSFTFAEWTYLPKQQYYIPPPEPTKSKSEPAASERTLEEILAEIQPIEPQQKPQEKKEDTKEGASVPNGRIPAGASASKPLILREEGYCGPAEAAALYRALEKEYEEIKNGWQNPESSIHMTFNDRDFTKDDIHKHRRWFFFEMTGRATPPPPDDERWKRNWDEETGEEYYDESMSGRDFLPPEAWDPVSWEEDFEYDDVNEDSKIGQDKVEVKREEQGLVGTQLRMAKVWTNPKLKQKSVRDLNQSLFTATHSPSFTSYNSRV